MMVFFLLLDSVIAAAALPPTPFPVFLKQGYSAVLEFEAVPKRVVLGDPQTFQVEKMDRSLVIRPLQPYATTNMFVYFEENDPRLFLLKAAEDAEPTLFKRFESVKAPLPKEEEPSSRGAILPRGLRLLACSFDRKGDYLTLNVEVSAGSNGRLVPSWELGRLRFKDSALAPIKLWAERKEVMRDTAVKARFIFAKPNVPKSLQGASFVLPLQGGAAALTMPLRRK